MVGYMSRFRRSQVYDLVGAQRGDLNEDLLRPNRYQMISHTSKADRALQPRFWLWEAMQLVGWGAFGRELLLAILDGR